MNVIYYTNDKMSDTAEAKYKYDKNSPKLRRAPQGRRLGDERLEVLVVLAVEYPRGKSREEARVSTQLVLNKYNTNYEALGWLTDCISF